MKQVLIQSEQTLSSIISYKNSTQKIVFNFLNKKNKFKAFLNNIYIFVNMENYPQNEHKHDRIMHH